MKIQLPRLDWPQVVLVLGLAALGAVVVLYGPEELHAPLAALLVVVAGGARSFFGGPPAPPAPPSDQDGPPTRPRRPTRADTTPTIPRVALEIERRDVTPENPRSRRLGADALRGFSQRFSALAQRFSPISGPTLFLAAPIAVVVLLPGCGASALRTHSTAATIASIAVGDLDARTAEACDRVLTGCAGEVQCVTRTAERCRVAGRVGDAVVASVRAYVDAVEVAVHAEEGEVLPALLAAWRGIRELWPAIVAALEGLGVTVPALPLLGGGS